MMNKTKITGLLGGALLLCGTQAQAAITWTFNSPTGDSTTLGNTIAKTDSGSGVTATAQAWANTNNGTVGSRGYDGLTSAGGTTVSSSEVSAINAYTLETAYLNVYTGGLGVKNQDATSTISNYGDYNDGSSPEHSTDNNQRYDSVLFSFSSAIDLNSVSIGWYSNDSDISVLRYDGDDPSSTSSIAGKTYAQLLTSGWNLVSQNAASTATNKMLDGTTASSYWLIGAANPLLGTSMDSNKDYVKLLALSGDKYSPPPPPPRGAPEPGTLLLMGAGLLGLTRINARRVVRSAA
jgi:hypothetical protein